MSNQKNPFPVIFTERQVEWLENAFPELVGNADTTSNARMWRAGQRSVIAQIRLLVKGDHNGVLLQPVR